VTALLAAALLAGHAGANAAPARAAVTPAQTAPIPCDPSQYSCELCVTLGIGCPTPTTPAPPSAPAPTTSRPSCDRQASAGAYAAWQAALAEATAERDAATRYAASADQQFRDFYPGLLADLRDDLRELVAQAVDQQDVIQALADLRDLAAHPLTPMAAGAGLAPFLVRWVHEMPVVNGQLRQGLSKSAVRRLTELYTRILQRLGASAQRQAIQVEEQALTPKSFGVAALGYLVTRQYLRLLPAVADAAYAARYRTLADAADERAGLLLARFQRLSGACAGAASVRATARSAPVAAVAAASRAYRRLPRVARVRPVPVTAGAGLSAQAAASARRLLGAETQGVARLAAMTTAMRRATAAARARDARAAARQWAFVRREARVLAALHRGLPARRAALAGALRTAGFGLQTVTILQPGPVNEVVAALGVPLAVRRAAADMGLPASALDRAARVTLSAGTVTLDPLSAPAAPELASVDATLGVQLAILARAPVPRR
jgi:hypothetical protein